MPNPLNVEVAAALNQQVNNELTASHVYRAMSAYFDAQELPGFATWFRAHAAEEVDHATRLHDHLVKRGARVEIHGIPAPAADHGSLEAAVTAALEMETEVTVQINRLFDLAHEHKEYGTQPVLHWFLAEQVNEEDLFRRLLDKVKAVGDNRWHLLTLDAAMKSGGV